MKRLIPIVFVVAVVVSLFAFPTYANDDPIPWNYNDYVTDVVVDGENDLVSFDVPLEFSYISVYNNSIGYRQVSRTGKLEGTFPKPHHWYMSYINPIDSQHPLSLRNVPDGATLTIETRVNIPTSNTIEWSTTSATVSVIYMNDQWQDVYTESYGKTFATNMTIPIDIKKVDGATSVAIVFHFPDIYPVLMNDYSFTVEIYRMHCEMAISSLYRLPEVTQQNNKLMTQINKKLDEQGVKLDDLMKEQGETNDKLDQIIDGTVAPSAPAGSGAVDDLGDLEDDLLGGAQDGLDQADTIFNNAPGIVALYATGFLFMSSVIEHVASAGWISGIITVSLALGLLGFIANIAVAVVRGRSGGSGKGGKT